MEELKDILYITGGVGLVIVILSVAIVLLVVNPIARKTCYEAYSSYSPQYTFWGGCKIDYNGKFTPVDMIKNINLSNQSPL